MPLDSNAQSGIAGPISYRELLETLNIVLIALDHDWELKYYNERARELLSEGVEPGDSFWDSLREPFRSCLEEAYKKALLGRKNQIGLPNSSGRARSVTTGIYDDVPLNMLEHKATQFEFQCEDTDSAYEAAFDLQRGNFLFRVIDITDRVNALHQAEQNRVELQKALRDMKEARNANPLTGLPGNIRVQKRLSRYLDENRDFALIYADLDHFKPFNDRYGFERGDKVLLMLRDLLRVGLEEHDSPENFLGHIGGDDFVIMTSVDDAEPYCEWVIDRFDEKIPEMYDAEDLERDGITTHNRQGDERVFSIMSLSMAVVPNDETSFDGYLSMTETAAELKKYVKRNRDKSNYEVDRR